MTMDFTRLIDIAAASPLMAKDWALLVVAMMALTTTALWVRTTVRLARIQTEPPRARERLSPGLSDAPGRQQKPASPKVAADAPGTGFGKGSVQLDQFAATLEQADIRHRLRQGSASGPVPERYRFASTLAQRGLSAGEIAQILKIPTGETEQLLKLARMTQPAA